MGALYGERVGLTPNAVASAGRLAGTEVLLPGALSEDSRARSASLGSLSMEGIEGIDGAGIPSSGKVEGEPAMAVEMGTVDGMGPGTAGFERPD